MRRSIVYSILGGAVASVALVVAVGVSSCNPGDYCVFVPQISSAAQTRTRTPVSSATARVTGTVQATTTPSTTRSPVITATPNITVTVLPGPVVTIKGLAILGDSTQDEYQADNPRGGDYSAVTLNWVEQLVLYRGVNLGPVGTRSEPRRSGFEYNWARSGDGAAQMISKGQHTGAAAQIEAGKVSHVAIQIGINDFYFSGLGMQIYSGTISGDALKMRLDEIVADIALATHTVHAANPRGVLLVAMQDYLTVAIIPDIKLTITDPMGKQRVIDAFAYINAELIKVAAQEGVPFFDYNAAMLAEINSRLDSQGFMVVGGQRIDLNKRGMEPHFGILDDGYAHPGTVISGLNANVYIRAFNANFGTNIAPLSDAEILRAAGIGS